MARRKAGWFLGVVALGQIISLGLQSHAQPRYVFVATALLVVLGVEALARSRWARPCAALALVATSWLGIAVAAPLYYRHMDYLRAPIIDAADVIRADSGDRPCAVVALIVPQLMWYSRCQVFVAGLLVEPMPADRNRYAASFTSWPIDLAPIAAAQHLQAAPIATHDRRTQVWSLR
jgi:hypothetical protein